MPASIYLADKLIRLEFRAEAYSFPATDYIGLSTTAPNPNNTNISEPSGGYARLAVTRNTTNWTANSAGAVSNAVEFVWPTATADWNTITHWFIKDALTGGNLLRYGPLNTPRTILNGGVFRAQVGLIVLSVATA